MNDTPDVGAAGPPRTSALLRQIQEELPPGAVTINWLFAALKERSFGVTMLVLAVLSLLPILSAILGLVLILPAIQMCAGMTRATVPGGNTVRIDTEKLYNLLTRIIPHVERLEAYVRPRMVLLIHPPAENLIGIVVLVMALSLLVPLPFTNFLPAIAIGVLSIGYLAGDGLCVLIGTGIAIFAAIFAVIGVLFILRGVFGLF